MLQNMKKSAFTLVEILIVVVLFGMLSGIILQTYATITKVAFRMEQDKELAKEALILSQVLQNISEEATLDYERYKNENIDISDQNGIVDKLYLTGGQRTGTQISSSGNCENSINLYDENYLENKKEENSDYSNCSLVLERGNSEETILLLWTGKMMQSSIMFKVIPFDSAIDSINDQDGTSKIWKPGFWILGALYSNFYDPKKWSNSSILPLQLFFGLKGKTASIYELTDETHED